MSETDLMAVAEYAMATASTIFEKEGNVTPIWLVYTHDGEVKIVATPFMGDNSKDVIATVIKKEFGSAEKLVFVSEAWFRTMKADEKPDGIPPSQCPDRQEALVVMAEDYTGRQISIQRIITRTPDGAKLETPSVIDTKDKGAFTGRFAGLLTKSTLH